MRFSLPVYVEGASREYPYFQLRMLFAPHLRERGQRLERVLHRLAGSVRKELEEISQLPRQDELAEHLFSPPLREKLLEVTFPLAKRTAHCRLLVIFFRQFERWLVHLPALPQVWFEVARPEDIKSELARFLVDYFRRQPKPSPEEVSLAGRAWLTSLELELEPDRNRLDEAAHDGQALLEEARVGTGMAELERVGRCLEDLYPDALSPCDGRGPQSQQLEQALESHAPVVVLGGPLVGKTALIHELARRQLHQDPRSRRLWLLGPQRLISGMSYLGQWERRLLAILEHAQKGELVLYFDDFPGLYRAGQSRDCELSVIDVLRPYIERRSVRVLAEMTPSAWSRLQERDRGLCDQFQTVHLEETNPTVTLGVLLSQARQLEREFDCQFELEAFETARELGNRHLPWLCFPGKAVRLLRQCGTTYKGERIGRTRVLEQFSAQTGLASAILDERQDLDPAELEAHFVARLAGQPEALKALVDTVTVLKAGLCEPGRPLANLLFVGPTGVGKTHCARLLAEYLFGAPDRMVRFDMNEFLQPDAVARLVGDERHPEGLLAAAVRRQPFCVLLLDEIEKAHPDVFNLLLGLLGDARLTDALGRTADFSQCLVILTSNVGAQEVGRAFGIRSRDHEESLAYRKAVGAFFAPEFVNRLDRIVPFARLPRDEVRELASGLIENLFHRAGLVRRQCILAVDPQALDKIVETGYHPELGARALKREVERHITAPLAALLASVPPETPTLLRLRAGSPITVELEPLAACPRVRDQRGPRPELPELTRQLEMLEAEVINPAAPTTIGEEPSHAELAYFAARDEARRLRASLRNTERKTRRRDSGPRLVMAPEPLWLGLLAGSLTQELQRLATACAERPEAKPSPVLADWALLLHTAAELAAPSPTRLSLQFTALGDPEWGTGLKTCFESLAENMALEARPAARGLAIEGLLCHRLLAAESGLHLFRAPDGSLHPVRVSSQATTPAWVVRLYDAVLEMTVDLRTGLVELGSQGGFPSTAGLTAMLLAGLSLKPAPAGRA
ncbi:MAG: AAA family ATPase [Vulcanimicrobiota bacterium]